jgi:hypothetical protein
MIHQTAHFGGRIEQITVLLRCKVLYKLLVVLARFIVEHQHAARGSNGVLFLTPSRCNFLIVKPA